MTEFTHHEEEFEGRIDLGLWRRIVAHAKPYRWVLLRLAGAGMLLAAVDVFLPIVTGRLIDAAVREGLGPALRTWFAVYLGLMIALCVIVFVFIRLAGRIATGLAYDIRRAAFGRRRDLSFSYFDQRSTGWLMARLTSDCKRLSSLVPWFALDSVWGPSLLGGIAVAMLVINWRMGLVVLTIVPLLGITSWFFQKRLLRSSRANRKVNSQITSAYNEGIMGVRTTKTLVREEDNLGEFRRLTEAMYLHSLRNALQSAVFLPLVMAIGSIGIGLALWRAGWELRGPWGLTVGELVVFMQFAMLFHMPVQDLARQFTQLQAAQASAERIQGLLDTQPEIEDAPEVRARIADHAEDVAAGRVDPETSGLAEDGLPARIGRIEFAGVDFAYVPEEPVLRDFDLAIEAGTSVALVGPTGGGKSTIVSLLCRFYEPTRGEIRFDGIDYRMRSLHWLQSNLGIVLQAPHLFSGTIRDNIRYGRLDASDADVEAAARLVNADEFIRRLEHGYETDVGEGGGRLSTGQKQLVSLARAVLADPGIFVMDEATSSVDTETERLIQDGIERVMADRTSFVIAHRLSTIRSADLILVIEGGRIVERGTHAELLARRGRYHGLYLDQFRHDRASAAWGEAGPDAGPAPSPA